MDSPELPDSQKGPLNRDASRGRQELLQKSSLSSEAAASPQSEGSASKAIQEAHHSTAVQSEASQTTDNPATPHPSQKVRTRGLESGDDPASLVRQEEVALILGVTPRCLENWRHRGRGPKFIRVSARCIRYRISDLTQWIEERVRTSTSDLGTNGKQ